MKSAMSDLTRRLKPVLAPLSKAEESRSIKSAVASLFPGRSNPKARFRVLGAELRIEKPPERDTVPRRLIQVFIADYGNGRNVGVTVDGKGKIVESLTLDFQPNFHADEVYEARQIAERNERVRRLAKTRGAFTGTFAPHQAAENGHRMIGLHYATTERGGQTKPLGFAVVDLYTSEIVVLDVADTVGDVELPVNSD